MLSNISKIELVECACQENEGSCEHEQGLFVTKEESFDWCRSSPI